MGRLEAKVAIVTGGASGIGEAIARRFATEGSHVVIADMNEEAAVAVAAEIGGFAVRHDIAEEADWWSLTDAVLTRHGRLDLLVNNAGISRPANIEELDVATLTGVININLMGVVLGCRAAVTAMRRNTGMPAGSIINIASIGARVGMPNDPVYAASKAGVVALTKSIAVYAARAGLGIRCNAILPGIVETEMLRQAISGAPDPDGFRHRLEACLPGGRLGCPSDVAAMAAFLASDEASHVNGAEMLVDGAMTAGLPGI